MDRTERERGSGTSMRTERSARPAPACTPSERLQALVEHASVSGDGQPLGEIVVHALEALVAVVGADRAALVLVGADGSLRATAWGGLSPDSLAAIEATPTDSGALLAALAPDGVADVNVWPLRTAALLKSTTRTLPDFRGSSLLPP